MKTKIIATVGNRSERTRSCSSAMSDTGNYVRKLFVLDSNKRFASSFLDIEFSKWQKTSHKHSFDSVVDRLATKNRIDLLMELFAKMDNSPTSTYFSGFFSILSNYPAVADEVADEISSVNAIHTLPESAQIKIIGAISIDKLLDMYTNLYITAGEIHDSFLKAVATRLLAGTNHFINLSSFLGKLESVLDQLGKMENTLPPPSMIPLIVNTLLEQKKYTFNRYSLDTSRKQILNDKYDRAIIKTFKLIQSSFPQAQFPVERCLEHFSKKNVHRLIGYATLDDLSKFEAYTSNDQDLQKKVDIMKTILCRNQVPPDLSPDSAVFFLRIALRRQMDTTIICDLIEKSKENSQMLYKETIAYLDEIAIKNTNRWYAVLRTIILKEHSLTTLDRIGENGRFTPLLVKLASDNELKSHIITTCKITLEGISPTENCNNEVELNTLKLVLSVMHQYAFIDITTLENNISSIDRIAKPDTTTIALPYEDTDIATIFAPANPTETYTTDAKKQAEAINHHKTVQRQLLFPLSVN